MTDFKVMTWNVENFFRPNPADAPAMVTYQDKLTLLAQTIGAQAPDVVALQEVGGAEPLLDLQQALQANATAYDHSAISNAPDKRGIRVAFLSKLTIEEPTDIIDFPPGPALDVHGLNGHGQSVPLTRMGRGALRILVRKDNLAINVLTAHVKSKLLSYPRPNGTSFTPKDEGERAQVAGIALMQRTAEVVTLRIKANDLLVGNTETNLIVLGDFNDVPDAQTSLILAGPDGSEIGTQGFNTPDLGDDARLFNLAPLLPPGRDFSRKHRGRGELLDQVFVSVGLVPIQTNGQRRTPIVDSLVDFAGVALPSITENPGARIAQAAPDHAPVVATFQL
jgi:endonuclease/exonuclease/phosphatase family metal-dependent hydrolase